MTTPSTLLIVLAGAVVGAGVLLAVLAFRGSEPRPPRVRSARGTLQRVGVRGLVAVGVALVVLVVTRWPVAALAAGAFAAAAPALLGGARLEREQTARLEGLAAWTESLRDTIAGAVGLEQAIPASVHAASPAIRPQLRLLVDRLRVRVPLPVALRRLADDLDDPSADLVIASLVLNSKLRGPGLRQVLTSLSESARAELEMRQRVSAGRASTRRSAQVVTIFSLGMMAVLAVANRDFVAPYGTFQGQLVLVVVAAFFAGGFWWMKRLSGVEMPRRFLVSREDA
ncbi:type II secretion system F family protein [Cellulomonas massiliensis]|uniref:type II secretion system F family protein n=1 Tax=Cellulomonas massiliensis TaxID=1465811 RepID=UPI0002F816AC|nr:type II secretion system F family protein [Cellulomonas massiliensis]